MDGVAVAVVHVVDVVAVRNGHMTASLAVRVVVVTVISVVGRLALVDMTVVHPVEVAIVHVIGVVTVGDGHVAASLAVRVAVVGVLKVCRGHGRLPFR